MATDNNKPFSYIEWLENGAYNSAIEADLFKQYRDYQTGWYKLKQETVTDEKQVISQSYINLLKEITLNYTSLEEKNFLSQVNYLDKKELDIIIPFFVKKLKQITQYVVSKRQEVKYAKIKSSFKGSEISVKKSIKELIIEKIRDTDFISKYASSKFPSVSSITQNLIVDVESLYDEYQHYFDIDSNSNKSLYVKSTDTDRNNTFDSNILKVSSDFWLDFDQAVSDLFSQIPTLISIQKSTLSTDDNVGISLNIFRSDVDSLDTRFLLDSSKINPVTVIDLQKQILEKFSGTSVYYLSTGSTQTSYVSGRLFEPKNSNSDILNRYNSTRATTPSDDNLVSIKDIGGFFTPDKEGILNFTTITSFYEIDVNNLQPNQIYLFPDPAVYGIGSGNSKTNYQRVIKHTDIISDIKSSKANTQQYGDISNTSGIQSFYPYQSSEETLRQHTSGISRSYDSVDFWTGSEGDIWKNSDVYPISNTSDLPIDSKQDDLLISSNVIHTWKTDIYGNEFALFKDTHPRKLTLQQLSGELVNSASQDIDTSTIEHQNFKYPSTKYYNYQLSDFTTTFQNATSLIDTAENIANRHSQSSDQFYFRNAYSNIISPVSSALSSVYIKYTNTDVLDEINTNIKSFDIIKDAIIIETDNYLVIEQYKFDLETNIFSSLLSKRIFVSCLNKNNSLEKTSNIWYDERNSNIYIAQTTLHSHLSASNYKIIYPKIYRYNLNDNNLYDVFSLNTILPGISADVGSNSVTSYNYLSSIGFVVSDTRVAHPIERIVYTNITQVDKPSIYLNSEDDVLGINFFARDSANVTYLYNLYFNAIDKDNFKIKQLDFFTPNTDCLNHNIANYVSTSTEPSLSAITDGLLRRGDREKYLFSYESFKSKVFVDQEDETYSLAFNSSLSGRLINPSHTFDHNRGVIRLGVGLSANETTEVSNTPLVPYSHNASYLLCNLPLSGNNTDISVTFDIALYTLTSGNSAYAQINTT